MEEGGIRAVWPSKEEGEMRGKLSAVSF